MDELRGKRKARDLGLARKDRPIGPLVQRWIQWRTLQRRAQKTIEGGVTATGHLVDFLGEEFPVEDVHARLQELFDEFLEAGYEPSTLDTMRRQLSSFFTWAAIEPNPARKVHLPDRPEQPARAWTAEELTRIRTAADGANLRLAVELALGTGGRQAEVWALERGDFSEARCTVHIRRQLDRSGKRKERLKGKRARIAVVLPALWEHLEDAPASGLLLHDGSGGTVTLRKSWDLLQEVLEDAGVSRSGIGWHSFRHTYARLYLDKGGWKDELQASLGHASIQTTERVYGHFAPDRAAGHAVSRIYGGGRHLRIV